MPIESNIIPEEAVNYLNEVESQPKENSIDEVTLSSAKSDLHAFCLDFVKKSESWRQSSFETKWLKYQRNCDGIYDPEIAAKKESWQSKVHVGITASHRETIHSHIFRVMAGTNPPLDVKARFELGDIDQSDNIRDIILREMDKTKWAVEFDKVLQDADTFGSGFCRISFDVKKEIRKLRRNTYESFSDNLNPMGMIPYALRLATNRRKITGYEDTDEEVETYRGLKIRHCSIWDIFPDPKAIQIPGSTIAYRFKLNYGDLVKGAKIGYYFQDGVDKLKGVQTAEKFVKGDETIESSRDIIDSESTKTDYGRVHTCYEVFVRVPKKWINTIMGEGVSEEEGEELVSARVIIHENALIAVEINDEYDGEAPIYKLDYSPVNGSFYGCGIPAMLVDSQDVINEVVNQRLDNGALALNVSLAVIEKALVNPKSDLVSKPGMIIRMDGNKVPNGDIRNVMTQLKIEDTPLRAGFSEVNEAERWAQERTSANRVTLGTAGLVKDANQTLGGQQILRESAGEKFSYIGLVMELSFLQDLYHGIWKIIYKNLTPEDIENSIGIERAQNFILITPEEIQRDYVYMPLGVFSMENKSMRQSRLQAIRQQFIGAPWIDDEAFFDKICQTADEDPKAFKRQESMLPGMQGLPPGMSPDGMPPGVPPGGQPPIDLTGTPMPPGGINR